MVELEGRKALVTGAARGIGRVTAGALADAGADVALVDLDPKVEEAAALVRERGRRAAWASFDIADAAAVKGGVANLRDALGDFDVLVNNAGITNHIAALTRMTPEGWERELSVNLSGAFHLIQALLPAMIERGFGRIIVISSLAARGGLRHQAGYAASKAGLLGLVHTVTLEHARHGVTCNAVLPGLIETEVVRSMPAEIREASLATHGGGGSADRLPRLGGGGLHQRCRDRHRRRIPPQHPVPGEPQGGRRFANLTPPGPHGRAATSRRAREEPRRWNCMALRALCSVGRTSPRGARDPSCEELVASRERTWASAANCVDARARLASFWRSYRCSPCRPPFLRW